MSLAPTIAGARSQASRVQIVRSPGGIEAWLVEDYALPLIALDFAFAGGASQDPMGKAGTAFLMAGLFDEGAGTLDAAGFHRAMEDKAIEISFSGDRDHFSGRLKTLARERESAFALLRTAVCEPRFDADAIDRVRAQVGSGLKREANEPDSMASRAFREAAYGDHPYGRPVRGSLESLALIEAHDLIALRRACLTRDGLKVAVVGAIDAAELGRQLDVVFGDLPLEGRRDAIPDVVFGGMGQRVVVPLDIGQTAIRFGRPGIDRHDPDYVAATVLNHILGGGVFSARLFKEVREKRGLAYSVYSQLSTADHSAMLAGGTSTKNERAIESLDVIVEQIRSLADEGPTEDELDKAKRYLIGSYPLRFDSSTKIAGLLVHLQLEGFGVDHLDTRNARIAAVDMPTAKRVARRLFGDASLLVTMAGKPVLAEGDAS